jgi:hypothetical protein
LAKRQTVPDSKTLEKTLGWLADRPAPAIHIAAFVTGHRLCRGKLQRIYFLFSELNILIYLLF